MVFNFSHLLGAYNYILLNIFALKIFTFKFHRKSIKDDISIILSSKRSQTSELKIVLKNKRKCRYQVSTSIILTGYVFLQAYIKL